jgi:hypothetical protein
MTTTGDRFELMLSKPPEAVPKKMTKSAQQVDSSCSAILTGYLRVSSVARQTPGYNTKGARPAFPSHGGFKPK